MLHIVQQIKGLYVGIIMRGFSMEATGTNAENIVDGEKLSEQLKDLNAPVTEDLKNKIQGFINTMSEKGLSPNDLWDEWGDALSAVEREQYDNVLLFLANRLENISYKKAAEMIQTQQTVMATELFKSAIDRFLTVTEETKNKIGSVKNNTKQKINYTLSEKDSSIETSLTSSEQIILNFDIANKKNKSKVKELQTALVTLGYTLSWKNSGIDGFWGNSTESSLNIAKINVTNNVPNSKFERKKENQNQANNNDAVNKMLKWETKENIEAISGLDKLSATDKEFILSFDIKTAQRGIFSAELERAQKIMNVMEVKGANWKELTEDGKTGNNSKFALQTAKNKIKLSLNRVEIKGAESTSNNTEIATKYTVEKSIVDSTIATLKTYDSTTIDGFVSNLAATTDIPNGDWTTENKTRRLAMAQYITDALDADSSIDAATTSMILERVLAQEKFESHPNKEQIKKMVTKTVMNIPGNITESWVVDALMLKGSRLDMKTLLSSQEGINIDGKLVTAAMLTKMLIVTGNGLQDVRIKNTEAFVLKNVSIVGNTLVGLMENGCEGNVVYIPLEETVIPLTDNILEDGEHRESLENCERGQLIKTEYTHKVVPGMFNDIRKDYVKTPIPGKDHMCDDQGGDGDTNNPADQNTDGSAPESGGNISKSETPTGF